VEDTDELVGLKVVENAKEFAAEVVARRLEGNEGELNGATIGHRLVTELDARVETPEVEIASTPVEVDFRLPRAKAPRTNSKRMDEKEKIGALLKLSHELGAPERRLAILGEGNTSVRLSTTEFAVKASGCNLATLTNQDVATCDSQKILALLDAKQAADELIDQTLFDARLNVKSKKPSVESIFHAWLLTLEGVECVGHTHPVSVNQILCSPRARDFAEHRIFPDEVVCCGPQSVFVPYFDPGLALAREIRDRTQSFIKRFKTNPRVILLQNHGIIALGSTPNAVMAATLMATKAAEIFAGAAAMGGPNFMTEAQVARIASRADEAHRQKELKL
jgi:rhamnose utilization protein RhaD (predicted bifunctional aldolase and dehydrogenase)